jgi:hypothetical protein
MLPINRDIALSTMNSLIEQAMGQGFFKRLPDLDYVRGALSFIQTDFENLENLLNNAIENPIKRHDQREIKEPQPPALDKKE